MAKHKHKSKPGMPILFVLLGLIGLGFLLTILLWGSDITLLNPQGLIAGEQLKLILFSVVVLLIIAVPALLMFYFFAWKYRESNKKATYDPDARHGKFFVFCVWAVPTLFAVVLALMMWPATQRLEPRKAINSDAKPLTIQVVALRWKWLFIYPEQKIATVNFVQIPVDTPIEFELTADEAPMSSFWIPHLGGQLYAMTGHTNRLNMMADTLGDYTGKSAEINGAGFADMKFTTRVSSKEDFDLWVQDIQFSDVLDDAEYEALIKPSEANPAAFYSVTYDLYGTVLMKYMGSHEHMQTEKKPPENDHHSGHEGHE